MAKMEMKGTHEDSEQDEKMFEVGQSERRGSGEREKRTRSRHDGASNKRGRKKSLVGLDSHHKIVNLFQHIRTFFLFSC